MSIVYCQIERGDGTSIFFVPISRHHHLAPKEANVASRWLAPLPEQLGHSYRNRPGNSASYSALAPPPLADLHSGEGGEGGEVLTRPIVAGTTISVSPCGKCYMTNDSGSGMTIKLLETKAARCILYDRHVFLVAKTKHRWLLARVYADSG